MHNILDRFAGIPIAELARTYGTPVFVYDRAVIEKRASELKSFDVIRYAQKASSNLGILALMKKLGVVVDAVSAGEVERALRAGFRPDTNPPGIVFTADLFDADAAEVVSKHRLEVNVGSPDMITQVGKLYPGAPVILRINPGFGHGHSRKTNTGGEWSKHGIWHGQLEECLKLGREAGVKIHGLHMHIGSGTDFEHLAQVCGSMVKAAKLLKDWGADLEVISAGGGLPIPYHKEQPRIDTEAYFRLWDKARKEIEANAGHSVRLEVEPGRYLVAESCVLVTQIRSIKKVNDNVFYMVDAGFDTLVRPAMYGSYHDISVCPADGRALEGEQDVVVAGPLCESGDVFTQEEGGVVVTRRLPVAKAGDYLILHDTGAYGAAMSSNYNTRRLAPELLVANGKADVIRERQSYDHILQFERIPQDLKSA